MFFDSTDAGCEILRAHLEASSVRVDVLVATAMRTYFGQIAISRLNWEFSWNAAVPAFRTVTNLREFSTVLRQTIEAPGGYLDRRHRAAKPGRYATE